MIRNLDDYIKLDGAGRAVIKKRHRKNYNLQVDSWIELKEYINEDGRRFLMLVPASAWNEDDYIRAAEILTALGEDIPISLLEKIEEEEER